MFWRINLWWKIFDYVENWLLPECDDRLFTPWIIELFKSTRQKVWILKTPLLLFEIGHRNLPWAPLWKHISTNLFRSPVEWVHDFQIRVHSPSSPSPYCSFTLWILNFKCIIHDIKFKRMKRFASANAAHIYYNQDNFFNYAFCSRSLVGGVLNFSESLFLQLKSSSFAPFYHFWIMLIEDSFWDPKKLAFNFLFLIFFWCTRNRIKR